MCEQCAIFKSDETHIFCASLDLNIVHVFGPRRLLSLAFLVVYISKVLLIHYLVVFTRGINLGDPQVPMYRMDTKYSIVVII